MEILGQIESDSASWGYSVNSVSWLSITDDSEELLGHFHQIFLLCHSSLLSRWMIIVLGKILNLVLIINLLL